ncbi:exodeoxyribonuclease V subunit gamma [Utexia brackfieldae]|uniref:exodeoxyribonuclease V subunit gamma n=1 Tax=Utexia brackfieldae TaxID=3074108 RepID=UPI00370D138B
MLTVYHSNQLELLKLLAAELIKRQPLPSVFTPEIMLVQSNGMAQWLQIQLAEALDVTANIDFIFPSHFIWQMYNLVLPDVPDQNYFEKDIMSWKLMQLLPEVIDLPEFSLLAQYLSQDNHDRKYYQLAIRIADLYDQYLVYRPDWIVQWESGKLNDESDQNEIWQAALWRKLIMQTRQLGQPLAHRANIYQRFIETLAQDTLPESILRQLPKRLFIFGITSLPPVYLASLYALGQHIDVHLMFTNPCRWYWGDIPDERWLNKLLQTQWQHYQSKLKRGLFKQHEAQFDFFMPTTQSNPLLASWGKLGRDNLFLLQDYPNKQDIEAFVDLGNDTLLSALQQHILDLDDKAIVGYDEKSYASSRTKQLVSKADFSISFHACHSELREVEVLYDYLLSIVEQDKTLSMRDIVVMVADIERYAPYINAVFGNAPKSRYLPFTISDRKIRYIDPAIQAFFTLLSLPQSRFTSDVIFDLLEVPALAAKFQINESQLKQLRGWCIDAGIRWGLDDEMVSDLGLPSSGQHTWHFGLTRMLLGYAMNSHLGDWQDIVPFDNTSGLAAELVGKLAEFLFFLVKWRRLLTEKQTLSEWRLFCYQLQDDLFLRTEESEPLLLLIEQAWQTLIDKGIEAGYDKPLAITVLHDALQAQLEQTRIEQRFLAGKINFCTMLPMRSIPFKVVCLLGMNEGVYPRTTLPVGFDLMIKHMQRGDRSRRDDDRYLFLEAILSAQNQLYISYIGKAITDNSERYPSVLVDELRDYLSQSFVLKGDEKRNIDESAQRLSEHLTIAHARMPFSAANYRQNPDHYQIKSYADEWLPAAQRQGRKMIFDSVLTPWQAKQISLDELKQFYRHPVRMLLQKRLNIYFALYDEELPNAESFDIDALSRYQLNERLLAQLIKDETGVAQMIKLIKAEGKIPYGAFGDLLIAQQSEEMQVLADKVLAEKNSTERLEVNIDLSAGVLQGWLSDIQADGLLRWRASKLSIYDGMSLWLEHLILTLIRADYLGESRLYGRDNSEWRFKPISREQAYTELDKLVTYYIQGMSSPLFLPLKSAWNWLESCYDDTSQTLLKDEAAMLKARQKFNHLWVDGYQITGECDNYYLRLFPVIDDALMDKMAQTAQQLLLPLRQARITS